MYNEITKGDNTRAFGNNLLRAYLNNPMGYTISKAVFQCGKIQKTFENPVFPLDINMTGAETNTLSYQNECSMALWDEYGQKYTAHGTFTLYATNQRVLSPDTPIADIPQGEGEPIRIDFDFCKEGLDVVLTIEAKPRYTSDLINDSGFINNQVQNLVYYTKTTEMNALLNLKANQTDLDQTNATVSNLSTTVTENYNTLDNKIDTVNQELTGDIDTLDTKIDNVENTLQGNIDTLSNTVTSNYATLDNKIDSTTNTLNQRITDVADELQQSIEDNVVALQQEDEALQTQITVNAEKIEELTVARFPNVVIIGTPHIEGGQVSNYSDVNYLQFPFVDISRGLPFDIYFSFTTSNDVTTQQNILDSYFGIALAIQNGKGVMALSSNGTSWDIGTSTGTNTLLPNTTYYVKYSWTGSAYSASLSQNEEVYVPDMNLTSSLSTHKTTIFIGGSPNIFGAGTAHPFKGTINFNKSKVVVNGIVSWEGMADVGLASRANVSLNNLDEVGEMRFNNKQDVIQDLASIREGASKGATAVQPTSYATTSTGGVIKTALTAGNSVDNNGVLQGVISTQQQYNTDANVMMISKGTLENIKESLVTSIADNKYETKLDVQLLEGAII